MKKLLGLMACAAICACDVSSTSNSSDGVVNGSVTDGNGVTVSIPSVAEGDSITYTGTECGGTEAASFAFVLLSDRGGACAGIETGGAVADSNVLILSVSGTPATSGGSAPSIGAATYTIGTPLVDASGNNFAAGAEVARYSSACSQTDIVSTSGTISVTSISGGVISGSYDVHFGASGHLSGTFGAPACSLTPTQFCSIGTLSTCSG